MSSLFDEMWPAFNAEVSEQLDELEVLLAGSDSDDFDVAQAFRLFHTIKSSAAMMDFSDMEMLAHASEDILDLVRSGQAALSMDMGDLLVACAGQLKAQLAEANKTKQPPAGNPQLLAQARDMLARLGGDAPSPAEEAVDTPAASPEAAEPSEHEQAFRQFAASLDTALPDLAEWFLGKGRKPTAKLKALTGLCETAGFPALASISERLAGAEPDQRLALVADLIQRLQPIRQLSSQDCGITPLCRALRPALADSLQTSASTCLEAADMEGWHRQPETLALISDETRRLAVLSRCSGMPALALLQRFVDQVLRETQRGNLAPADELRELIMGAWSLCLEVEPDQDETEDFADICGRLLAALQDLSRQTDSHQDIRGARERLTSDFEIPYSLVATLHDACLPELLKSCERGEFLLDIEVDMDGPDTLRDSFLEVIESSARVISNRTVFASDRPGDANAETTRLSIIAASQGDPAALSARLVAFNSPNFHLAVTPVDYVGAPDPDQASQNPVRLQPQAQQPAATEQDVSGPVEAATANDQASTTSETLRIGSRQLDQFVSRVGELALVRNRLDHQLRGSETEQLFGRLKQIQNTLGQRGRLGEEEHAELAECLETLTGLLDELEETDSQLQLSLGMLQSDALELRVVPIDTIFRRMPVLVRRLGRQLNKQVSLNIEGRETRIDKSMVDVLAEPLTHMVRNALDHGIELPAERAATGKPEQATITLRASHQGSSLVIELIDDGRGLAEDKIIARAVERGLLNQEEASRLDHDKLLSLIFQPGFSTAESITETSGRGVGMDVVRNRIEQLGGEISLTSRAGAGCHFVLALPLSAAIQGIIVFTSHGEEYGIAERSVAEILEVSAESLQTIQGQTAIMHRDHALPVYSLPHLLQQRDHQAPKASMPVLLINDGRRQIGLIVDQVSNRQEIFVRDCHPDIASLPGVAGASVLGNGNPILIMEPAGLIDLAARCAEDLVRMLEAS